jgi:hypothetical protein
MSSLQLHYSISTRRRWNTNELLENTAEKQVQQDKNVRKAKKTKNAILQQQQQLRNKLTYSTCLPEKN